VRYGASALKVKQLVGPKATAANESILTRKLRFNFAFEEFGTARPTEKRMGATYVGVRRAHPYSWLLSSPQQPLETEDPPTVSLAPQYTSQRLCRARTFLSDDRQLLSLLRETRLKLAKQQILHLTQGD
jgi:hypothetical protein